MARTAQGNPFGSSIDVSELSDGTAGELITWNAAGAPATVAVGTATHVLTSNGVGAAPTFQAAGGGGSGIWDITSNVVSNTGTNSDETADDFVFGSDQLDDDGSATHDKRVLFDKSTGAFRAGTATGVAWNVINRGLHTAAFGLDCVAVGQASFATGSSTNATGLYALATGFGTTAANVSAFSTGTYSNSYLQNQFSNASSFFTVAGDAQSSFTTVMKQTTDATQTELTLGGGAPAASTRLVLPASRTWTFRALIAGRQTATAGGGTVGDSGAYEILGCIERDGSNNTNLVGAVTVTTIAEDNAAWDVTADADDTNESLRILVTGVASATIHWVAKVEFVEVG